jgi:hypothetical protein
MTDTIGDAQPSPPRPPAWAARSIPEGAGVVHETISRDHPAVRHEDGHGWVLMPTDVSLSAIDIALDDGWVRAQPTIQLEGGSYPLDAARALRDIIDNLLHLAETNAAT